MIDELTVYNLSIKHPNTIDLVREVEKMARADAIKDFAEWLPTKFDLRFASDCPKVWVDEFFNHTSEKILEQVKEQK